MAYEDEGLSGFHKGLIAGGIVFVLAFIPLVMWGCPRYSVWTEQLSGLAELKKAEWNKQVLIQDANAKMESAKALAEAEIIRAKGVAQANQIIGEGLRGHEEYLRYLWIHAMGDKSTKDVIYVPTEAGLPVLEAGRFREMEKK